MTYKGIPALRFTPAGIFIIKSYPKVMLEIAMFASLFQNNITNKILKLASKKFNIILS
jgi:hypothetical protein